MRLVSYEKKEVYPPSVEYALISLGEQILLKKKGQDYENLLTS